MQDTPTDPLLLERFLPYRLSVLSNLVSGRLAAHYSSRFGLGIPEWRVLAVLAQAPGLSAAEVVARTAMDKVAVSRAVAALLRDGRLERSTDLRDRRRSSLRLSADGAAVYEQVVPVARRLERGLLDALAPPDREALDRILRILLAQLQPAASVDERNGLQETTTCPDPSPANAAS
ncbi:MAG: MarR family transcriptional regulator [Gammaproteobacteria bacterium]|nr:MarR family transcriptional regulator [Gammaproteobacteria bacterium]